MQAATQNSDGPEKLEQLRMEFHGGQRQPLVEVLLEVFHSVLVGLKDVYIILDALDECLEQERLVELIKTICGWRLSCLHVLVTSRQTVDIEDALGTLPSTHICLEEDLLHDDIQIYIRERLQGDRRLKQWEPQIETEIEKVLMEGAHGM